MVDVAALGYMELVAERCQDTAAYHMYGSTQHLVRSFTVTSGVATMEYRSSVANVSSHRTVNHSVELVESVTGVHTQNIESYWNRVKMKLKRMKGCRQKKSQDTWMSLCGAQGVLREDRREALDGIMHEIS